MALSVSKKRIISRSLEICARALCAASEPIQQSCEDDVVSCGRDFKAVCICNALVIAQNSGCNNERYPSCPRCHKRESLCYLQLQQKFVEVKLKLYDATVRRAPIGALNSVKTLVDLMRIETRHTYAHVQGE